MTRWNKKEHEAEWKGTVRGWSAATLKKEHEGIKGMRGGGKTFEAVREEYARRKAARPGAYEKKETSGFGSLPSFGSSMPAFGSAMNKARKNAWGF